MLFLKCAVYYQIERSSTHCSLCHISQSVSICAITGFLYFTWGGEWEQLLIICIKTCLGLTEALYKQNTFRSWLYLEHPSTDGIPVQTLTFGSLNSTLFPNWRHIGKEFHSILAQLALPISQVLFCLIYDLVGPQFGLEFLSNLM